MDDLNTKVITAFVNKYGNIEDIGEAELKDHIIKFSNTANDQLDTSKKSAYLYLVHVLQRSLQKYSVQQNYTISTIQTTRIDESMLNVEGKNEIPEILTEQQNVEQPKKTSLGKKLAGLGLLALGAVGAYAARKTGSKIPLPGSNQLMEAPQNPINSGLIEYGSPYSTNELMNQPLPLDTGFSPAQQQTGLMDLHPDEKSDRISGRLGEAYRIKIDMSDKQALKTMYTGYDASRNYFKPEDFRNFAADKFYGHKAFYEKCFFLDKYGYPEQDKDGNLIPRAGINLKDLADNLYKDGSSDDGIGAIFSHISGIEDVFKQIKPEDYKRWMGSEAFKVLCKEYGIKEGVSPWWLILAGGAVTALGGVVVKEIKANKKGDTIFKAKGI